MRWLAYDVEPQQAGALTRARVALENAGAAPWRGLKLSYHWLDERGNPIVWDGRRTEIDAAPGERVETQLSLRAPIPPGAYRLAFDLVDEGRFWLAELGNYSPEVMLEVTVRDASAARAHLPPEADLDPNWEERVYAAHTEGYAAVGGSIDARRPAPELEPYAPEGGRKPGFRHPLVLPSLLPPLVPNAEVAGLPAWQPEGDEPWLYDARIKLRLRLRSRKPR